MVVREKFNEDLNKLENKLIKLSKFAQDALQNSLTALKTKDIDLALKIMDEDTEADLLYEDINDFATLLITKQQPVASDLRKIMVTLRIATDIERIADFAVNISRSAIRIGKEPVKMDLAVANINKMYEIAGKMFKDVMEAFKNEDLLLAKEVADMDDDIDKLYGETIQELFKVNHQSQDQINILIQLLFLCRYLERTGDHITNISESIFYLVKGKHYDLNE